MAKNKVDLNERIPWNGENHKGQGYNAPTETNLMMAITPEQSKGNIVTTGIDKNGRPLEGTENRQNEIISTALEEGLIIKTEITSREDNNQDMEHGE